MGGEEESRKRRQSSGSDNSEEAARQNPRQRNTRRPDGSGSSSQLPHRPAQQPAQDEEMPDAPSVSGVAAESSRQGHGKRRLGIGDGGFSFPLSFRSKHPGAAVGMHTTSYEEADHKIFAPNSEGSKNKQKLKDLGVKVSHGVDVRKLGEEATKDGKLGEDKYTDTHFHYPRGSRQPGEIQGKKLLSNFAKGSHGILEDGGNLHFSIPSSETYITNDRDQEAARELRNRLYGKTPIKDTEKEGYKFLEKRRDIQERFGKGNHEHKYKHEKTGKETGLENLVGREYVFEKSNKPSSPDQAEYSDVTTDPGTESSASEQESENEEMEPIRFS